MDLESRLKAYSELVGDRLDVLLPTTLETPGTLHEAMRYAALAAGKRLRPALLLACAEAVGGTIDASLDAACAVELVHAFSLVHDDLPALDDDDLRRGRPTCHVQYGEAIAILAGDALFSAALHTMARSPGNPQLVLRSLSILTAATTQLVNGETIDILSENQEVDRDTLQKIHERKTGALIAASCEIGAILGGGNEDQVARLRRYGERVGLAFQIADDVLNVTSSSQLLGKAAGSDVERGKATYPALYGLEAAREAAQRASEEGIQELADLPDARLLVDLARFAVDRLR